MRELWEFTKLIRSKNAGPFELTFDIMFKEREGFRKIVDRGTISAEAIARLYGVEPKQMRYFVMPELLTVKFSIPRTIFSGDVKDTDVYGGQFHGPLLRLPVE
jgi:hypothetical protein